MIENIEELKNILLQDTISHDEIFKQVSKEIYFDSETLDLIKERKIKPTLTVLSVLNKNKIDTTFIENEIEKILEGTPENIVKQKIAIANKLDLLCFYLEPENKLFSEDVINKLGVNNIALIYKYGYLPELGKKSMGDISIDFNMLLERENLEKFMYIYTNILGYNEEEIDIKSFLSIARKYIKNSQVFNQILQDNSLRSELKGKLHEYFLCNYEELKITCIDDIRNIETLIKKQVEDDLKFSEDFLDGDTEIFLITLLTTKRNGLEFLSKISDEKIKNLSDVLSTDDEFKDFENLEMLPETRALLALIFKNHWANKEQRELIEQRRKVNIDIREAEKRIKYNPDDIFKNKSITKPEKHLKMTQIENTLVEIKESLLKKIIKHFKKAWKKLIK